MRFFPQVGLDPVEATDGPTFFLMASRLGFYDGVIANRIRQEVEEQPKGKGAQGMRQKKDQKVVPLAAVQAAHADLVEVVNVG